MTELLADLRVGAASGASEAILLGDVIVPRMERIVQTFVTSPPWGEHAVTAAYNAQIGSAFVQLEDYRDLLGGGADASAVERHLASIMELYWPATRGAANLVDSRSSRCFFGFELFGWKIGWQSAGAAAAGPPWSWSRLDGNVKVVAGLTAALVVVGVAAAAARLRR